tara:strand:+ start:1105 stop:2328 length:1224 start_codon:yes stop_codon:yes gene_type:complete
MSATHKIERNIRLYQVYYALYNAFFWMPVFILFLKSNLSIENVLLLESIYYISVFVLEVPSGYLSDRLGRRVTLILSSTAFVLSYLLFSIADGFIQFGIAQFLLAAGISLASGTDTSFHYDSLQSLGKEEEYEKREAMASRNGLISLGLAALIGGAIGSVGLGYCYMLALFTSTINLLITFAFIEPVSNESSSTTNTFDFKNQIKNCLSYLKQPYILWLFSFSSFMILSAHVPYEFYQIYIERLDYPPGIENNPSLISGIHMLLATLLGSFFASKSVVIKQRFGTPKTLLSSGLVQVIIIASMAIFESHAILILLVFRSVPSSLTRAPLLGEIVPKISKSERATFLSIQSLSGRVCFAGLLLLLALYSKTSNLEGWSLTKHLLLISTVVSGGWWVVLLLSRNFSRPD